jgi:hypothetical protein
MTLAEAATPVPIYTSHIIEKMPYSANTFLLKTSDALDIVTDFYRSHLKGISREHKDAEGSIFYVTNGATVTITPGNHFDPGTAISYSWDARKFGTVPVR